MVKLKPAEFCIQVISALIIAYLTSLTGFIYSWPSYTTDMFSSNETVLYRPMTATENNLMGTLTNVGALIMTPICGIMIDSIGRKYTALLLGLPFIISWIIIATTKSVYMILLSVFIAGIGAAGQVVAAVYISEIVDPSIRGGLTTSTIAGYYFGVLISYILGGQLTYEAVAYAHLGLSLLYICLQMLLKESPLFLIRKGKEREAAEAIAFYTRLNITSKEVKIKVNGIKRLLRPQFELLPPNEEKSLIEKKLHINEYENSSISSWRFLLNSKSTQKALVTVLTLMTLTILMGAVVLQVYAEPLFKAAVPSMSANTCAIVLAVDFLVSCFISASITDKVGRKILTTWSSTGAGVCAFLLGLQLQMEFAPTWFTPFIIYLFVFIYSLGASTTPFVLAAEVFLPEVKGFCNSICVCCLWVMNFVTLLVFNYLVEAIGLDSMFYVFSSICFMGAWYCHFYVPETKGLSPDDIQLLFWK